MMFHFLLPPLPPFLVSLLEGGKVLNIKTLRKRENIVPVVGLRGEMRQTLKIFHRLTQLQEVKPFLLNSSTPLNLQKELHKSSLPEFPPALWVLGVHSSSGVPHSSFVCSEVYAALPSCLHPQHFALTQRVEAPLQTLIPVN